MKRFAKIMALFAVFALALFIFDKLQPTLTKAPGATPLTTYAVYEVKQLQWAFDDTSDYSYDESIINLSGGEAKLKLQTMLKELKNQTPLTIPLKGGGKYNKKLEFESEAYSYKGTLKTLFFSADKPSQTGVKLKIRTAGSQQALEEAEWQPKGKEYYTASPQDIAGIAGATEEPNGYVQYKAVLETDDDAITPTLNSVTITYETQEYPAEAAVSTKDYLFGRSVEVQALTTEEELKGQTIKYEYSTDSGSTWKEPVSGQILAAATDKIAVKATLGSNGAETPAARDIKLSYRISVCDENWQANYTGCGKNDERTKYYTDANNCGSTEDLPADNGTTKSCDYCTPQWSNVNSSCRSDDTTALNYFYTNSCCQETALTSDCTIPQNTTAACDYCTPSFACSGYSECNANNQKTCLLANDTNNCNNQTRLTADSYRGDFSEFTASCAYDTEKPSVNSAIAAAIGNTLTVMANITDKSAITAIAHIIKDNNAVMNLTLTNTNIASGGASDIYAASANAAELDGAYIVSVLAKDSYGNTELAQGITGLAINAEKSAMKEIAINSTGKALIVLANAVTIEVNGKAGPAEASTTGRIIVAEQTTDERNTTKPQDRKELGRYIEIEADEALKSNFASATLKISYSDEEVAARNISETSLAIHYYNEPSLLWQPLNSAVNTELNYVEGNTTHLSLFGVFGNEQSQTVNTTINATINATVNATMNVTINATINSTTNATENTQKAQAQPDDTIAAAAAGGEGEGTGKKESLQQTKPDEATSKTTKAQESCSYNVAVEMEDKPSFINKTSISAALKNTGTCAIENLEVKVTQPLDDYIAIENGKAAQLEPEQSITFAIKSKTAGNGEQEGQEGQAAQGQPLQGFAVKEQRKTSTQKGKIIITGNAIKETALEGKLPLQQEVPLNIEVYELEQKGEKGKSGLAVMITGLIVLAMLLTITYNRIIKFRKKGAGGSGGEAVKKEADAEISMKTAEAAEGKPEEKTAPTVIREADHETLKFHESLKKFEEKENLRQTVQQPEQEKGETYNK